MLVADDQQSLAIGKDGQNVRLAARLTGWKIDIKKSSEYDQSTYIQQKSYQKPITEESLSRTDEHFSNLTTDDSEE